MTPLRLMPEQHREHGGCIQSAISEVFGVMPQLYPKSTCEACGGIRTAESLILRPPRLPVVEVSDDETMIFDNWHYPIYLIHPIDITLLSVSLSRCQIISQKFQDCPGWTLSYLMMD